MLKTSKKLSALALALFCSCFDVQGFAHQNMNKKGQRFQAMTKARFRPHRRTSQQVDLHMHIDPLISNMIIGGISGTVSNMVVFPVDLIKTRMQNAVSAEEKERNCNFVSTLNELTNRKGILGLWQGSAPVLFGSAPESAIQLAAHSWLIGAAMSTDPAAGSEAALSLSAQLVAGALAGGATLMATCPMEVLRLQLSQCDKGEGEDTIMHQPANPFLFLTHIQAIGLAGLFRGSSATLLRDMPFSAIYYTLYCHLKTTVGPLIGAGQEAWTAHLVAGLVAGSPHSCYACWY
jgi:solute carrier family 25 aspartate/glutamate transporter 12/13